MFCCPNVVAAAWSHSVVVEVPKGTAVGFDYILGFVFEIATVVYCLFPHLLLPEFVV